MAVVVSLTKDKILSLIPRIEDMIDYIEENFELVDPAQFDALKDLLDATRQNIIDNKVEIDEELQDAKEKLDLASDRLEELAGDIVTTKERLNAAEVALGNLDNTTLPSLWLNLNNAQATLDSAFPSGPFDVSTSIVTQTNAAQQAAIEAAAIDAQNKANSAQTAAEQAAAIHAELVAQGAETAAIEAAALDAQNKANAAEQAAITAASLDATDKANTARQSAIDIAATDAQSKADAAKSAAEAAAKQYADGEIDASALAVAQAAALDAQNKANAAQQAAITAAEADATTKANTARQSAIDAAAADATSKANDARADAESAAATHAEAQAEAARLAAIAAASDDASDKAAAAQAAAEEAAAADALAKANTARDDAIAHADLVEQRALSRGTDLITNGTGYLGNNYNFTTFVFDATDSPTGTNGSFRYDGSGSPQMDEFVPIDPSRPIKFAFHIKDDDETAVGSFYSFVDPYTAYGQYITPNMHMYVPGTITTLAQDLSPGDTQVHLTDATGWAQDHFGLTTKSVIFWDYVDPGGKLWEPETLGNVNIFRNDWTISGNIITLNTPYDGPSKSAGTLVSNSNAGGGHFYTHTNIKPGSEWEQYTATLSGLSTDGRRSINSGWPPGTAQVRVGWLLGYSGRSSARMAVAGVSLSDAAAAQQTADEAQITADAAMVTANGKNLATYTNVTEANKPGPAPTSTTGRVTGDTHRNRNASTGEIYAEYLLGTSGTWQSVNFGDAILRSLDVGKITGGSAAFQQFVAQHLIADIAQIIQLDAGVITTGQLGAARIDVSDLAADLATILRLDAGVITTGRLGAARIDVNDLAANIATIIELNANRITTGRLAAARIDVNDLAANIATILRLDAGVIVSGEINTDRLNALEIAAAVGSFLEIEANQITTGVLSAAVTLSGILQTGVSGTRVAIDPSGLYHYNDNEEVDFSATGRGVTLSGTILAGTSTNGIMIAPDSSRLGNGIIEFRSSLTPKDAEISLVAGDQGAPTLYVNGPATSTTYSTGSLSLGYSPHGTNRTRAKLSSNDTIIEGASTQVYALSTEGIASGGGLLLDAGTGGTGSSLDDPGIELRAPFISFRGGSILSRQTSMRVVGDLDITRNLSVGLTLTTQDLNIMRTLRVQGTPVTGQWQTFIPTITTPTVGGNPTIGNTQRSGRWQRIGRTIFFSIDITIGSTFRPGSGAYIFGLPVPARSGRVQWVGGHAHIPGDDRWNEAGLTGKIEGSNQITRSWLSAAGARDTLHSSRNPPAGSTIIFSGTYEAQSD